MARAKKILKGQTVTRHYVNFFPLFLFLIQLSGVLFMGALFFMAVVYLHGITLLFIDEGGRNLHIILAPFAFVYLTGQGILLFRLMRNIRTSIVKVCHAVVLSMAVLTGILSIYTMWNGKEHPYTVYSEYQNTKRISPPGKKTPIPVADISHFPSLHSYLGYIIVGLNLSMFIFGTISYLVGGGDIKHKKLLASMHGVLGVFTVIGSALTASCGILSLLNNENYFYFPRHVVFDAEYAVGYYCILSISAFSWLILYVVMNPHFKWVPLGPV